MNTAPLFSKEELEKLAARCYRSPVEFARVFFSDWFSQPMPWFHRGILALLKGRGEFLLDFGFEQWAEGSAEWTPRLLQKVLDHFKDEHTGQPLIWLEEDAEGNFQVKVTQQRNIVIIVPRGFSKTTLMNMNTCHEIAYHDNDYFLYISEADAHAQDQLETVKAEFESNEMLRTVFGNKVPPRQGSKRWASDFIETLDGIMVGTVGTGGQIRGKNKHGRRPKVMVFDDLQNEKSVESETELKKDSRWFWRAAMKAGARGSRKYVLGTLLHKMAILNKAVANRQFAAVRLAAIDRDGEALWEWHMNLEQIEEDRQSAIEAGELEGWYMEMMSEFRSDETAMFPESKIVYVHKGKELFTAIGLALDPAISENRKADEAAMAVVGIEARGFKHALEVKGKKGMDPYEMLEMYFDLHFEFLAHLPVEQQKHGIESVAYQSALLPICRSMMVEKSRTFGQRAYFEVTPILHGRIAKVPRIKGILKPLIWSRTLTFEEHLRSTPFHTHLTEFPRSDLKDRPDAVAMAVALLDPFVMLGLEEEGVKPDFSNDNALPLDQVLGGSFRSAP